MKIKIFLKPFPTHVQTKSDLLWKLLQKGLTAPMLLFSGHIFCITQETDAWPINENPGRDENTCQLVFAAAIFRSGSTHSLSKIINFQKTQKIRNGKTLLI